MQLSPMLNTCPLGFDSASGSMAAKLLACIPFGFGLGFESKNSAGGLSEGRDGPFARSLKPGFD